jgi:hypothetical protein
MHEHAISLPHLFSPHQIRAIAIQPFLIRLHLAT